MHAIIIPQGRGKRGENVKSQLTTEIQKDGKLKMLAEDETCLGGKETYDG